MHGHHDQPILLPDVEQVRCSSPNVLRNGMGSESQAFHYRHVLAENAANKNAPTGVKIAIKYNGISSFLLYRLTTICSHPLVRRANDNYYHSFSFCLCIYGRITECY